MRFKGMRALGAAVCAAAMTAGLMFGGVSTALATTADVSGNTEWADPTGPVNNWKEIDGKQYKYITMYADMWAASGPDYVGISNAGLLSYSSGDLTLDQAKKSSLFGIWASAANEEPNPYQANYYWNLYANSIGSANTTQIAATSNPPKWDSASGVWDAFKFRPDFVLRCNALGDAVSKNCPMVYSDALGYINQMKYYTSSDAFDSGNVSEGKTSEYYIEGDETYTPERHTAHNENPFTFVDEFYWEAEYAEQLIADTANNPQVSADELNWKTANKLPRTVRYNTQATQSALDVEKLVRGSIYYTLEKINDGTVNKKKVAFLVNSPESTGTTVQIATFDFVESISQNGGSATGQQGTGTTTRYNCNGFVSFAPLVVDQAQGTESQLIWRGGIHVPSTNETGYYSDTPYSTYEVTADDILDCDIIYGLAGSMSADELKTWMKANVTGGDAAKQKADSIQYLTAAPTIVKGANYTAEKLTYGVYAVNAFYPTLFPNMELSAFWFDNVYHLKSESVATALNFAFANASLPEGVSLTALADGYSIDDVNKKVVEGYKYFESAQNTDPVLKRILANQDLSGKTTGVASDKTEETAYDFSSILPYKTYFKEFADATATDEPVVQKPQTITAKDVTKTFKSGLTFSLGAKTDGDGELTYATSNKKVATVSAAGKVTVKGAGTAEITINAAATDTYEAATKTVTVKVNKAKNPVTIAKKTISAKASQLKKAKKTFAISKAKKAQGKVTYSISKVNKSKKYFSINKTTGKITVKKGLKKGTYKVTVKASAKGNTNYKSGYKTAVVTFKVK